MNDKRRKTINKQWHRLQELSEALQAIKGQADEIKTELEQVRDEEQEAFDNLSESLQGGERGQAMEQAVELLDTVISYLENIADLEDADEHLEALDNAESCGK